MQPILVCLHGWGGSKESFTELREALKGTDIQILTPDLPGFGDEPEPSEPWTVDGYADWVLDWLQNQSPITNHQSPIHLLGHSHGGRIAIKLAVRQSIPIEHLYLCAAAGIKRPRHIKRIIGLVLAKCGNAVLSVPGLKRLKPLARKILYKLVRVHDYEKASPLMQQTLMNVTREDLRPLLSKINLPTDIFWGESDGMTPFADAKIMLHEIKGSRLHRFPGVTHRVHRMKAQEIANTIRDTIGKP